jgi:hypothetical protein
MMIRTKLPSKKSGGTSTNRSTSRFLASTRLTQVVGGVVHPSGVEPEQNLNKHKENAGGGHKNGHADADLARIITVWEKLPAALKAAILAIVKSVEVGQ